MQSAICRSWAQLEVHLQCEHLGGRGRTTPERGDSMSKMKSAHIRNSNMTANRTGFVLSWSLMCETIKATPHYLGMSLNSWPSSLRQVTWDLASHNQKLCGLVFSAKHLDGLIEKPVPPRTIWNGKYVLYFKLNTKVVLKTWEAKSTGCFSRGLRFDSQHQQGNSQPSNVKGSDGLSGPGEWELTYTWRA